MAGGKCANLMHIGNNLTRLEDHHMFTFHLSQKKIFLAKAGVVVLFLFEVF